MPKKPSKTVENTFNVKLLKEAVKQIRDLQDKRVDGIAQDLSYVKVGLLLLAIVLAFLIIRL